MRLPEVPWRQFLAAVSLVALAASTACSTTGPKYETTELEAAQETLQARLPGDPAILYRLRVRSATGLRLAVRAAGDEGRLTVSEPFGSAVSLTAWKSVDETAFYDLREGCRIEGSDLSQALGIGAMPLPQALRLLGGRLPAVETDTVTPRSDGRLVIEGQGWAALVSLLADPWRVVLVEEVTEREKGWRIELSDHRASVPGSVRLRDTDGHWVELQLVRFEWTAGSILPPLPNLPLCELKR
jgi:hypothetical protein